MSIVDSNFVRPAFYIQPPKKDAPAEVWEQWMKLEKRLEANDKRAHTKSLKHAEIPDSFRPSSMTKIGGVWRQSPMVGLVGSSEEGTLSREVVDPSADQHRAFSLAQMENERNVERRGVESRKRKARSRRKDRAARMAKKR